MTDAATTGTVESVTTTPAATTTTTDWRSGWTDDLKAERSLESFKDSAGLAKAYVDTKRMQGNAIWMPKADATPEEKAKFFRDTMSKFGLPNSPDGYTYTKPALPDGAWSDDVMKSFLSTAHASGLTSEQVQKLVDWQAQLLTQGSEAREQARDQAYEKAEAALKARWGGAYQRNMALANDSAKSRGPEFVAKLRSLDLDNDPDILLLLADFGQMQKETGVFVGSPETGPSQASAAAELERIMADKTHPYHKGDQKAVERYLELVRIREGAAGRKEVARFG